MTSGYCPNCGAYVTLTEQPVQWYWAVRGDRIRKYPEVNAKKFTLSWLSPKDIVESDGHVIGDGFVKITVTKFLRKVTGYCLAECFEPYNPPTPETDPDKPENANTVFDLSAIIAKAPGDPEITYAKLAGRAAQYIDVRAAGGTRHYNVNLCGEFCSAAIGQSDIIPFLQLWLKSSYREHARDILADDDVTGISDLTSMLAVFGLECTEHSYDSINLISPLKAARGIGISGCAINKQGRLDPNGSIRHWVVIEDCLPVGTSGWIRLYNPMVNKSEVYNFDTYAKTNPGVILWLTK
jgi:hypothetical protein